MAKFEYCLIKVGYEGKKIKTALSGYNGVLPRV